MVAKLGFLVLVLYLISRIDGESFDIDDNKESLGCSDGLESVFTPSCTHYHDKFVIQLIAMKYGFLPRNQKCSNETRGCEYDVSSGHFDIAIQDMLGRQQSDPYRFPTSDPQLSQKCRTANYSSAMSYMKAYYNCIRASKMKDICSDIMDDTDEIYFWNEGFPDEGAQTDRDMCDCLLEVTSDTVEVVTFYKKLDCSQNLTLKYASSNTSNLFVWNCSQTVSKQETTTLGDISNQNLSLTWMNNFDGYNRTGKYWIKLKAVNGTIRLKCPMHEKIPETTPTLVDTTSDADDTTQIHADTTDNVDKGVSDRSTNVPVNINPNKDDSEDNPFNLTILIAAGSGGAVVLLIVIIIVVVVVRRQNANIEKIIEQRMSEMNMKQGSDKRYPNAKNGRSASATKPMQYFEEYERRSRESNDRRNQIKIKQQGREPREKLVENGRESRETNYMNDQIRSKQRGKKSRQDLVETDKTNDKIRRNRQRKDTLQDFIENERQSKESDYAKVKIRNKQQEGELRQSFEKNDRRLREADYKDNQTKRNRQGRESLQEFIENERRSKESNYTQV